MSISKWIRELANINDLGLFPSPEQQELYWKIEQAFANDTISFRDYKSLSDKARDANPEELVFIDDKLQQKITEAQKLKTLVKDNLSKLHDIIDQAYFHDFTKSASRTQVQERVTLHKKVSTLKNSESISLDDLAELKWQIKLFIQSFDKS